MIQRRRQVKKPKFKPKTFCYTAEELENILDSLGEPQWSDDSEWAELLERLSKEKIAEDGPGQIAQWLRPKAIRCLEEALETFDVLRNEQKNVQKIGKLSGELKRMLLSSNSYRATYAHAFMFDEALHFGEGSSQLAIIQDLERLESLVPEVCQHYGQANRVEERKKRNAPVYGFVSSLIYLWETWTQNEAGASKAGGPAARFVVHALEPVERFAAEKLDIKLRVSGQMPVTVEAAGSLIQQNKRKERKLGNSTA